MKIRELEKGLIEGKWTCMDLALHSLKRIAEEDQKGHGLNAVCELNPDVLFLARQLDQELKEKGPRGPLHGIPVLLKDNIAVKDVMHTTAGSLALNDLITEEDAYVTEKLKKAGALILGKTNLSEFAHWMDNTQPSGFSSRGGQVVSPYKRGYDPSGSSSGSGVAAAARYVPCAIGTETDGSLTSPGRANAVAVIKPTVGRVSRSGIIPISHIQDTAGPMASTMEDCAVMLEVLQGRDEKDPATWNAEDETFTDVIGKGIEGWRVGLITTARYPMNERFEKAYAIAKDALQKCGAEIVEIHVDDRDLDEMECLLHEFKNGMERWLSSVKGCTEMVHLSDIIAYNKEHADDCLQYGQDLLIQSDEKSGLLTEPEYIERRLSLQERSERVITEAMMKNDVKCLVMVQGSHMAPVSGFPVAAIPCEEIDGQNPEPKSMHFISTAYDERTIIQAADACERVLALRKRPSWVKEYFED